MVNCLGLGLGVVYSTGSCCIYGLGHVYIELQHLIYLHRPLFARSITITAAAYATNKQYIRPDAYLSLHSICPRLGYFSQLYLLHTCLHSVID